MAGAQQSDVPPAKRFKPNGSLDSSSTSPDDQPNTASSTPAIPVELLINPEHHSSTDTMMHDSDANDLDAKVGISCFVSPKAAGFSALFKTR